MQVLSEINGALIGRVVHACPEPLRSLTYSASESWSVQPAHMGTRWYLWLEDTVRYEASPLLPQGAPP